MNVLLGYIRRRRFLYLFVGILMVMGLIVGFFLGIQHKALLEQSIRFFATHITGLSISSWALHFAFWAFFTIFSFLVIGIPFFFILFFLEGLNLGFLLGVFLSIYGMKGLLFGILFVLVMNGVFFLGLFFLFPKCLELARLSIAKIWYHRENEAEFAMTIKSCMIFIGLFGFFDMILVFISPSILQLFRFLLVAFLV